tara:strand:- start:227 stop:538 length:312 start_codon:yes stop_codon:yes gene_type:complete
MEKRKLCKYQQLIKEVALTIFEDYGGSLDSQTIGQAIQEGEDYGSFSNEIIQAIEEGQDHESLYDDEISRAIQEGIDINWLLMELENDILKEINEINMITVQP